MALAISDDHRDLEKVVQRFTQDLDLRAEDRALLDDPTRGLPDSWTRIADQGWLGLHVAEEYGGSGFGLLETAIVAEALGAAPAAGPFLASVTASALVGAVGTAEQRAALLPGLAEGSLLVSVPTMGGAAHDGSALDGSALDGTTGPALAAAWAQVHLVPVGDDLVVVRSGDPGVEVVPVAAVDAGLGVARLQLTGAVPDPVGVLQGGRVQAVRLLRTFAAAEAAGGTRAALDMALGYAKLRHQFGRPIGSFQAVKHHLANMLIAAELATAAAWDAARAQEPGPEAEVAAAVAAVTGLDAYLAGARKAIQLLGGIGFTWEHDAHLYLRRATALAACAGPLFRAASDVADLTGAGVRRSTVVDLPPQAQAHRVQARAVVARYQETAPSGRRALLAESGYLVPHWPKPFGRAADATEQLVLEQELAGVDLPDLGISGWVVLTLVQCAGADQVERWVMPALRGETKWCQLFSEPDAGSDAAAVTTRATKVDGGWRINGQKTWTSDALACTHGLATIRTNSEVPKHRGITAMAIELSAPGVTIRPLREITGEAWFNEVFFDDVFVPDEDVVGAVDGGWTVARATLGNERVTLGGGTAGSDAVEAADLLPLVQRYAPGDVGLWRAVGTLVAQAQALRLVNLREVERAVTGSGPSAAGNVTKVFSAEHGQRVTELALEIVGAAVLAGTEDRLVFQSLFTRCSTIAGGTSEVSRNVVAERILGLPREQVLN